MLAMEDYFRELRDALCADLAGGEMLLLNYRGEASDFARLNHARIRQAGHVHQQALALDLICDGRESVASMPLCGSRETDLAQARRLLDRLRKQLGWTARGGHAAPRIHDLRHTFICRRVLLWHEHGADIDNAMVALSTYVGHAKVSDTYWYLTAAPDLMSVAGRRFEQFVEGGDA